MEQFADTVKRYKEQLGAHEVETKRPEREKQQAYRREHRMAKYRNLPTHKARMIERRAEQNLRPSGFARHAGPITRLVNFWRAWHAGEAHYSKRGRK